MKLFLFTIQLLTHPLVCLLLPSQPLDFILSSTTVGHCTYCYRLTLIAPFDVSNAISQRSHSRVPTHYNETVYKPFLIPTTRNSVQVCKYVNCNSKLRCLKSERAKQSLSLSARRKKRHANLMDFEIRSIVYFLSDRQCSLCLGMDR